MFLGASANPFAPPLDFRVINLARKIAAGAQFIQTQYCYDVARMQAFVSEAGDRGLLENCFLLAGVGPLASAKTARWMINNVPGVYIPDAILARLDGAKDQREEGIRICIEIIQQVKEIKGISGVHVMAYRQEKQVPRIIEESGALAGRKPWSALRHAAGEARVAAPPA